MKTWNAPVAVGQRFAANEYVSACTATIKCDLDMNGYLIYMIPYSDPVVIAHNGAEYTELPYKACGEEHSVELGGELREITIYTAGRRDENNQRVYDTLETPITAYYWELYNEEGQLVDMHCTSNPNGYQANMS